VALEKSKKFVTSEYHEGQIAYEQGKALTMNPYLQNEKSKGGMWYWVFGWQDAMADDVRSIKQTIMFAAQPIDKRRMN
jgi:ribosome modulation factor